MIIDSSAIVAILGAEPEAAACAEAIKRAGVRRISAVSFVEVAIVIDRRGDPVVSRRLDDLIAETDIAIEPVTVAQAHDAFANLQDQTGHKFRSVIIKADPKANYGVILQIMDAAKSVDLNTFGLANHIQGLPEGQNQ